MVAQGGVSPRAAKMLLAAIVLLAIALRLAFVLTLSDTDLYWPDPTYYDQVAWGLVSAAPAGEAVMRAPFQAFVMAVPYAVAGHSYRAAYVFQALLGGLLPILLYRIASLLRSRGEALVAALIVAVYPYYVYSSGVFYATQTATILLLLVVYLALRANRSYGTPVLLLEGLSLGCLALTRSIALILVPVSVLWTWPHRGLRRALIVGIVAVATVAPWTLHNYIVAGEFIPISVGGGREFLHGVSPGATATSQSTTPLPEDVVNARAVMDKMEWDRFCFRRGVEIAAEHPGRYMRLYWLKLLNLYRFYPKTITSNEFTGSRTTWISILSYGPILLLAIAGVWIERRRWREYAPPLAVVATFSLAYPLFTTCVRYRLPIDAYLILFASVAIGTLGARIGGKLGSFFSNASPGGGSTDDGSR
jgi:hypothetical protein